MILCLDTPQEARQWCERARSSGASLGFVPTMGALHAGHLELVARAAREHAFACVSVFVNPLQFNDPRDFQLYPRDFSADAAVLDGSGAQMVFQGRLEQFFPECAGDLARIPWTEPGPAAEGLEGSLRPGHFRGVATIVRRLFEIVSPDAAYFGEKDFQQTLVVRELVARWGGPRIVVCPTSREPGGLARSSRNARLDAASRARAQALSRALFAAREGWRRGERDAERLRGQLLRELAEPGLELEYAELRDPEAWGPTAPSGKLERAQALLAVRVGGVRLIDTLRLDLDGDQ